MRAFCGERMLQLLLRSRPLFILTLAAVWMLIFFIPYIGRLYRKEVARIKGDTRTVATSITSSEEDIKEVPGIKNTEVDDIKDIDDKTDYFHAGEFSQNGMCLDTIDGGIDSTIGLWECHGEGGNQFWFIKKNNALKNKHFCVEGPKDGTSIVAVSLQACDEKKLQSWEYLDKMIKLSGSNLCLDTNEDKTVFVNKCDKKRKQQNWTLKVPAGM